MNTAKQRQNRGRGNLKPWPKGCSGNPKGRPKKTLCIADTLRNIGSEPFGEYETRLEALCRLVYDLALKGTPWAVQFIADRTEGKPVQMTIETMRETPGPDPFAGLTTDELRMLIAHEKPDVELQNGVLVKRLA